MTFTFYPCERSACCRWIRDCWVRSLSERSANVSLPLLGTEPWSFSHIFTTLNVSKVVPSYTAQFITKVTSFDPFFGPSSDPYYRTHKRNNRNYLHASHWLRHFPTTTLSGTDHLGINTPHTPSPVILHRPAYEDGTDREFRNVGH